MRVALFSDIHANLAALDAVLADIQKNRVDQLVCLGDVVDLGPQPVETLARVRSLACPCVMGNHDPFLVDPPSLQDMCNWAKAALSGDDLAYLRSFDDTYEVTFDDGAVLLCVHGSPTSFDEQLLADTPEPALDVMIGDRDFIAMAAGHTHVQMTRRYRNRMFINIGSVGMAFERPFGGGPPNVLPWAEYAIVDYLRGALTIELRRVPYDLGAYQAAVRASSMPNGEWWLAHWNTPV
jgi:predicted phosphodiesterase